MCIVIVANSIDCAPTPLPMIPLTVLPKPGHGHRKLAGLKQKVRYDLFSSLIYKSLLIDNEHHYVEGHKLLSGRH